MNDKKYTYSVSWSQPYSLSQVSMAELDMLMELVIEQLLDAKDFKEADEVLARIKSL